MRISFKLQIAAALVLAAIGVFGLVVNIVAARTREIGLRMALGARPGNVLRHVALPAVVAALTGIVLGTAIAAAATRLMAAMLFGIKPTDLATFAGVTALLLSVALVACYNSGLRATQAEPLGALRYE